ncbi:translation initiation factor IF-2 [Buchnera aphidicola (Pseudoregma panicola)]|uniref:translation initiation factor IF-2 n=1 Tax=Buchnera aphidicola TaxID=9 RepID=UPI0031B72D03
MKSKINKKSFLKKKFVENKNIKDKKIFIKNSFSNKFKKSIFIKSKNRPHDKVNSFKEDLKNKKFLKKNTFNKNISSVKNKNFNKIYSLDIVKKNNVKNKKNILKSEKIKLIKQSFIKPNNIINKNIVLNENISLMKFSSLLGIKVKNIYEKISKLGIKINNNFLSFKDTKKISELLGYKVIEKKNNKIKDFLKKKKCSNNLKMKNRPPIVTIMGHVDHGKTSILDCIISSNIKDKEFGGITQNISIYNTKINNKNIVFLDTPGHEIFSNMRSRGAKITDLIVLVVAADDGVMPQTIEAIKHAKTSNVPIIIAVNKIDKVDKNIDFIKNELMKYEIVPEELGGENVFVSVSAKFNKGIDNLLDAIFLQTEILELKTFYECTAKGVVIESFLDKNKGIISVIIVQEGTLKIGDFIICDLEYGKVKAINDEFGNSLKFVTPSIPVRILGLSGIPISGSSFVVTQNEKKSKEFIFYKKNKDKQKKFNKSKKNESENFLENIKTKNFSNINLLIKADSQGSLEAIYNKIFNMSSKDFVIKIISSGVGSINESDVSLAETSKSIILAFNVYPNKIAKKIILLNKLDIKYHSIIYNLLNEIELLKKKVLSSNLENIVCGVAHVKNVFKVSNLINVAGCIVTKGFIQCNLDVNIIRNKKIIFTSKIDSIKHFKKDIKKAKKGLECGIIIKNFNKIKIKDVLEVFINKI